MIRYTLIGLYNGEMHTITTDDFSSNELNQLKEMLDRRYNSARNKPRVMGAHSNGPLLPSAEQHLKTRLRDMLNPPARQIDERRSEVRALNDRLRYDKAGYAIDDGLGHHYKHLLENWDADDLEATNQARKGRSFERQGSQETGNLPVSGWTPSGIGEREGLGDPGLDGEAGSGRVSDIPQRLGFDGSGSGGSE